MTKHPRSRRSILASTGTLAAVGLAGCLGGDDEPADDGHDDDHDDHDDHDDDHHDDHDHDHDDDHDHDHEDPAYDLDIIDRSTDEIVAYVHGDHWHGGLPDVEADDNLSLGAVFTDSDGEEVPLGTDEEFELNAVVAEGAEEGIVSIDRHGDHVHINGEEAGRTEVVFQLFHDDHSDFDSPPIDVVVE